MEGLRSNRFTLMQQQPPSPGMGVSPAAPTPPTEPVNAPQPFQWANHLAQMTATNPPSANLSAVKPPAPQGFASLAPPVAPQVAPQENSSKESFPWGVQQPNLVSLVPQQQGFSEAGVAPMAQPGPVAQPAPVAQPGPVAQPEMSKRAASALRKKWALLADEVMLDIQEQRISAEQASLILQYVKFKVGR